MIVESNITNSERQYRNFCGVVSTYHPSIELDKITVEKTPKGNWKVFDKDGVKVCLVSKFMLSDELAAEKKLIKTAE